MINGAMRRLAVETADRHDFDISDATEDAVEAVVTALRREQVRLEFAKQNDRSAAFKIVADWMEL